MCDFVNIKMAAEQWLRANKSRFQLIADDQKENRLSFGNPEEQISFIVICPSQPDGVSWSVCSEQEDMLTHLQDVMEFVDSQPHLTIDRILDRIARCFPQNTSSCSLSAGKEEHEEEDNFEDAVDDEDEDGEEEDDDGVFGYYDGDDPDACDVEGAEGEDIEEKAKDEKLSHEYFEASGGKAKASTIRRLYSDMKSLAKTGERYGFTAGPDGNNLFRWKVKLLDIPQDCQLGKDLQIYAHATKQEPAIQMEMLFPSDYPYSPPFLRVLSPRFQFLTGHVTVGGSICMEMLTKSGWRPTNDIEGILVQVRCEILSDSSASLDRIRWSQPYTEQEAREAFDRMVAKYGWDK